METTKFDDFFASVTKTTNIVQEKKDEEELKDLSPWLDGKSASDLLELLFKEDKDAWEQARSVVEDEMDSWDEEKAIKDLTGDIEEPRSDKEEDDDDEDLKGGEAGRVPIDPEMLDDLLNRDKADDFDWDSANLDERE